MSAFACCFWWFLLGLLLGWLLNWLLSQWLKKDDDGNTTVHHAAAPVANTGWINGIDTVAAAAAGFSVKGQDDIIIIEGIGPKIKDLFNQNGVSTFTQVSKLSVAEMSAILDKGGPRFKMANPGSWAEQARLAANNQWMALKKLQDDLYAGVAVSTDDKA
jgi:predicted flap endonuclease-1-like 5' DNA nuclease